MGTHRRAGNPEARVAAGARRARDPRGTSVPLEREKQDEEVRSGKEGPRVPQEACSPHCPSGTQRDLLCLGPHAHSSCTAPRPAQATGTDHGHGVLRPLGLTTPSLRGSRDADKEALQARPWRPRRARVSTHLGSKRSRQSGRSTRPLGKEGDRTVIEPREALPARLEPARLMPPCATSAGGEDRWAGVSRTSLWTGNTVFEPPALRGEA